ncbi:MAG: amino acid adenylation domain-containing protein [Actinomycetota bacterium]|nr:amino acid adenylation domain-containing protein [Actinomycetota bacterium]
MTSTSALSESQRALLTARLRRGRTAAPDAIQPRSTDHAELPLSFGQEQLWFLDQIAPGRPTYNIPFTVRLQGKLDLTALGRGLSELVSRHEILRTRLVAGIAGRPVQLVDEASAVSLPMIDLSDQDGETRLRKFANEQALRPFDLARGPLFRTHLVRLAADSHVLLMVVHHTVFDGWSSGVLLRELAALYEAATTGGPADVPKLPVQFADYALWERERLQGPTLDKLTEYWRTALQGLHNLQLPTDRPRPALDSFAGSVIWANLGSKALDGVRALSREHGSTPFSTLLAALQVLLHRYTGQDDIVVGTASANRSRAELAPLIGFLVNLLPIRTDLSGDPSFEEVLRRVHRTTLDAYAHQELPFANIIESLRIERDPSRAPVFQIAMSMADTPDPVSVAGLVMEFEPVDLSATKFDLDFYARIRGSELWIELSYSTELFDRDTVRRLLDNFGVLLAGLLATPDTKISRLPLLDKAQRDQEIVGWNRTAMELPAGCLHERFELQVDAAPDRIAIQFEDEQLSYAQLNADANRLARWLHELGVRPDALVGVSMAASTRRVTALLAILKAGAGYLPLDPALPAERLAFMISDAGVALILADEVSAAGLPETAARVVRLAADWSDIERLDASNPQYPVADSDLAYAIYTSGSTGQPKGVLIEHRQVVNLIESAARLWSFSPQDRALQFASLNFDASVLELFLPLLSGALVVLGSRDQLLSPPRLAELMRDTEVSFAVLSPAVGSLLSSEDFPALRLVVFGGEQLPAELVRSWTRPGLRICNAYGPTEDTVMATVAEPDGTGAPPIGLPIPNQQAYVLDSRFEPVPCGVIGELYLGGSGVARGYLNRPELTAQRFVSDPFSDDPTARLYRTGDLVRRRADGNLMFIGRVDGQVKLRGLRVELGEIESVLTAHPAVLQATATVLDSGQLVGYVRTETGAVPTELAQQLRQWLPGYMVPGQLVALERFPLTSSGKVDRARLPAPYAESTTSHTGPRNPTETVLVTAYATLLDREQVGIDDSFFELGGNSLQAMQLVARLAEELSVDIGVTSVFLAPTPRELGSRIEAIRSGASVARSGPILQLSEGDPTRPLYLLHAIGGTVTGYLPLVQELAGEFTVFGIGAAGLTEGTKPNCSLTSMVEDYLRAIRSAQPVGPYQLAGWSMGGVLAYELAKRLEQLGETVDILVLLDAPFSLPGGAIGEDDLAEQFVADAARTLGWPADELPGAGATGLSWLARRLDSGGGDLAGIGAQVERRFEVFRAHHLALAGYQPSGSVRSAVLLIAAQDSANAAAQPYWLALLDGAVSTKWVPGDHYSFLQASAVDEVATLVLQATGRRTPA